MNSNDRYNVIKELLQNGEKDLLVIGKKAEYKGSTEKRIKDSSKRFIRSHEELKLLYESSEKIVPKKDEKKSYHKHNEIAPINFDMNWEELVLSQKENPMIQIINNKFKELENNIHHKNINNPYHNDGNIEDGKLKFELDKKYLDIKSDEVCSVSLRLTREARKKLNRFAEDHSQYKKVYVVSQIIEEIIKKY